MARIKERMRGKLDILTLVVCGAIIAALSVGAYHRNMIWTTGLGLWRDSMKKSPEKPRPANNYAMELIQAGRYEEAIAELKETLRMNPKSAECHNNLASIYAAQGKYNEALEHFLKTLKLSESENLSATRESAHNNIGVMLVKRNAFKEAIYHFDEAIKIKPDFRQAKENRRTIEEAIASQKYK